jgi:NAD(P)-dependent dehydrogenase (short-subunit alcohol dehydrogenase family)
MTKPTFDRARERGKEDRIGQINPAKRYGHPSEIGEAACFLLSDRASYVNGHALPVDGGLSASHPWPFPRS